MVSQAPGQAQADRQEKPNVLLIMLDDFGAECVGIYGGESYKTTNMDSLAAGGMRFTNAYTPVVCTPTRVQIMSGQYPFRNRWPSGIWKRERQEQVVDPQRLPLGAMMQRAGYKTAVAGKWQLGRFDDHPNHAALCGFDAHCLWTWRHDIAGKKNPSRYWSPTVWQNSQIREDTKDKFGPDLYCQSLIDFMRKHRGEPMFLYYPMALVHLPLVQPPGCQAKGKDRFAAMVAYADELIGRLVSALDELGLREKTLIIITGDNGTPRQITSLLDGQKIPGGKNKMTETGARVPLIANWPGQIAPGRICDDLVDTSDILPTLAELAKAQPPQEKTIDGRSFAPQLKGQPGKPRDWVYVQRDQNWFLRSKKYRLDDNGSLYDMSNRYNAKRLSPPLSKEATAAKRHLQKAFKELRGSGGKK